MLPGEDQTTGESEMTEAEFAQQLETEGYSVATVIKIEPGMSNDMHTHDFSAFVMVQSGTFTLVTEDASVTHQPGETCKLSAGILHCEQAGAEGATILIGKK